MVLDNIKQQIIFTMNTMYINKDELYVYRLFVYLSLFLVYIITFTNIYIHIKYIKPFYTELQDTITAKYMYIKSLSMYVT